MQSLFAYDRCKEANIQLAFSGLDKRFSLDLNSMEAQDKALLKKQNVLAGQMLLKTLEGKEFVTDDLVLKTAVEEALITNQKQTEKDFLHLKNNLVTGVEKINRYYYAALGLLITFFEAARADKKPELQVLANNSILKALSANTELQKLLAKENNWRSEPHLVLGWYKNIVKPNLLAGAFTKTEGPVDTDKEQELVKHISRKLILNGTINDYFAERDIRWSEDHDIIKSLVDKTIKSYDAETQHVRLQKLSRDRDDDLAFINTLFVEAATIDKAYKDLIAKNTKNWEVDRLPLTDRIILEMAIAELIYFPSIPVKVSINEYIELAKKYSTPKSSKFINGILDVMAKELQSVGAVKKSGKGLIDNK